MATFNLRRFSNPAVLRRIQPRLLLGLLETHRPYFAHQSLELPPQGDGTRIPYDELVGLLMSPESDMPPDLAEALWFIHEMSTDQAMDSLLREAELRRIPLTNDPDPTPADIAIQVWLHNREILERKHAEQYLTRPRSFEYFQSRSSATPSFEPPDADTLEALQNDLDDWFDLKKRGRGSKVFVFPKANEVWFLVRHGEPFRREGSLVDGEPSSVFYRPEKYDVAVYNETIGELRINARSKGEKHLYRTRLGLHLFGDEEYFPDSGKYTLEPLRRDGFAAVVCQDIEGMEWVKLTELHHFWGGLEQEVEIRKAQDLFLAFGRRDASIPEDPRLTQARFRIKFADAKTPRTITIKPPNVAQFTRDSDSDFIEEWLVRRGFVRSDGDGEDETP